MGRADATYPGTRPLATIHWEPAVHDRYDDYESSSSPKVSLLARVLSTSHQARGRTVIVLGAALVIIALLVGALALYPVY